jgi:hypothetical protein
MGIYSVNSLSRIQHIVDYVKGKIFKEGKRKAEGTGQMAEVKRYNNILEYYKKIGLTW